MRERDSSVTTGGWVGFNEQLVLEVNTSPFTVVIHTHRTVRGATLTGEFSAFYVE